MKKCLMNSLTPKQEKFVYGLIKGLSQRQAYIEAYPNAKNWKEDHVDSQASKTLKIPKVLQRYQELQQKAEDEAIMTSIERKKWLTEIIRKGEMKVSGEQSVLVGSTDRLKAMDILNKMDSEYTQKAEIKIEESSWFK